MLFNFAPAELIKEAGCNYNFRNAAHRYYNGKWKFAVKQSVYFRWIR